MNHDIRIPFSFNATYDNVSELDMSPKNLTILDIYSLICAKREQQKRKYESKEINSAK